MVKVKLKWNKQVFEDVEVDTSKSGAEFKEQLYQLTGVPVERQKVMAKGVWKGTLKDGEQLSGLKWKEGALIAMMGTSTGIPKPPEKETVFVEDMTVADKQKIGDVDPPGLQNLGNTCYMNATLQCLKAVPELREALEAAPLSNSGQDISEQMVASLRDLYKEMDAKEDYVTPGRYVQSMRLTFPQFAQQTPRGGFAQQDADEYFNELMNILSQKLTVGGKSFDLGGKKDAVSALFGIPLSTEMKCIESEDEPVSKGEDFARRLQCTINNDVITIEQGLKLGCESELEKNSEVLKRNALFKQTRRMKRVPKYLAVQMNRFFWKRTPDSRDHQGVNCKILKPVKFGATLDVFDLCDDELQALLKPHRDKFAKERMAGEEGASSSSSSSSSDSKKDDGDVDMQDVDDPELKAALALSMQEGSGESAGIGVPPDFRGVYELIGVVTHKGRDSSSGHYMGWVKKKGAAAAAAAEAASSSKKKNKDNAGPDWYVFDDETVSRCKEEDVLLLHGGGDREMGYLLFYAIPGWDE